MRCQPTAGRRYQTLRGTGLLARAPGPILWCYTSAMFCPQCRVEYRPGFTRCTDCDVDLVDVLPFELEHHKKFDQGKWEEETIQDGEELRVIWEGDAAQDCAEACRSLQEAEIDYRVNDILTGQTQEMGADFKYQVAVRTGDCEIARKALGYSEEKDEARWTEEEVESGVAELPAQDDVPIQAVHGDWNPRGWFREDATAEVWSGHRKDWSSTIEMSLKENRINFRSESQENEPTRIFVMPEDETQAKEIVREIVDGLPPE